MTRALTIAVLGALICARPLVAGAQTPSPSFAELAGRLAMGVRVEVRDQQGQTFRGSVRAISATGITLSAGGMLTSLPVADVKEVRLESHRFGWDAVPIGAAVGFAVGYSYGACHATGCADNYGPVVGIILGLPIGAAVGVAVHFLVVRTTAVYVGARRQPVEFVVAPAWTGSTRGLFGVIRF